LFDIILDYSGWTIVPSDGRCIAASSRRTQVLLLCDRRNYDPSIAGLGTDRVPRYFAFELERISDRLFGAGKIQASKP